MNDSVKLSINSRKDGVYKAYDIKDEALKKEIDALFKEMEKLGKDCKDSGEFEAKLAASSLNQKYIDLFTKVSTKCKPITYEKEEREVKSDKEKLVDDLKDEAEYQLKEATLPARRIAREEMDKKLRSTPVIGDVIQAKQTLDVFNKFRRKKKKDEDE